MTSIIESENAKTIVSIEASENFDSNLIRTNDSKFTRAAVEALGNRVSMTDIDETSGLELFCYVKCGPEDCSILQQCRGVVFNDKTIVMRAFPYTLEIDNNEIKHIEDNISSVFQDCSFYDSYEGTLIRIFNFSGRWFISTHRKLNAFRSKWSSKESFGTAFKRALESEVENNRNLRDSLGVEINHQSESLLESFQNILDPNKQYMFLVLNNDENRIVCDCPIRPTLFHVGTFVEGELVMNENINIPYPKKHTFTSIDSLVNYVNNIKISEMQGVIVFAPNNKQYKVLHTQYLEFFRARGNEPSIKYRYLQVRMQEQMVNKLYDLYPNMSSKFEEYENALYAIAQNIYNSYIARFIKKKWVTVAGEEFNVIRECHSFHEQDRKQNRISLDKVIEILNKQTPTNLNKMIRRFQNEKDLPVEVSQPDNRRVNKNTASFDKNKKHNPPNRTRRVLSETQPPT